MNNTSIANDLKKLYLIVPFYAVILSTLYLSGYWGAFNINIFEYLSLNEVIKLSIYPLGGFLFFLTIILSIILIFHIPDSKVFEATTINNLSSKESKLLRLISIVYIIVWLLVIIYNSLPYKWIIVGVMATPLIIYSLIYIMSMRKAATPLTRIGAFIFTLPLCVSYGWGDINAQNIKFLPIVTSINDICSEKILIGRTDKYIFLMPLDKETRRHHILEIISTDSINKITYQNPYSS